jgi:hypothetical protein
MYKKFQEEIPLKLKSLAVITLLVIGCSFASAQTFGFESIGHGLYCNYEVLQQVTPYNVWQGRDVLSSCNADLDATIAGVTADISAAGNPAGFQISKGVAYADNIYDAFAEGYSGAQWEVVTATKCSLKGQKYGWIDFASVSGFIFGDNYGYLDCSFPGKNGVVATRGLSTGSAAQLPAKK